MQLIKTKFADAFLINPDVFKDARGFFMEAYNAQTLASFGIYPAFVQDNQSFSKEPGVLRGLHYQLNPKSQAKLVRVLRGAIYDVIVDLRRQSSTFGKWQGFIITEYNKYQLFVPKGFAHGFCTLVPDTEVMYKVDSYYSPDHERGIQWDDPELNIDWPVTDPILSEKDQKYPGFKHAEINF
ncbi:dTDP-4-dehydrorhamnose 3,5-epimerase [Scopulibacillus daqui]|uniref:dTDP-4-dehydrorhamnose 3,5-epimerase n=1 Tax=Scopulibacillus daqui TaxID=1469162 RepID=A0ABS2PYD6_9BACL|nr:dTDP-4-dehydrorhamnose 3,5-epimerase [Scopulibacillus daqui]MBM7645059.1 dTDP-4-dehydrorhamnose 3,5-epimerase [Scopulibacillus daqui]